MSPGSAGQGPQHPVVLRFTCVFTKSLLVKLSNLQNSGHLSKPTLQEEFIMLLQNDQAIDVLQDFA